MLLHRKIRIYGILLSLSSALAFSQATAVVATSEGAKKARALDHVFHSASLGRDMHYLVLLPREYEGGGRFPVLYLLHGLYGDYKNWDTRTRLEAVAESIPWLIAMPDADDSWYTNSATMPADKFEDYITKDLINEIDGKYRTLPEKNARAIAGLSMGGYGAIKFALKHPELFVFAGSLSGALNAPQNLDDLRPEFRTRLLEVFGSPGNHARAENDVFLLLRDSHGLPYFYLACGTADFFLDTNRALASRLSTLKIPYEYHETPGDHSWSYWDSELPPMLQVASRLMESAPKRQ